MHEASLAWSLVHMIEKIAAQQGALGVVTARVRLGSFSCMSQEELSEYFTRAAKGTRVEGALLKMHSPPAEPGDDFNLGQEVVLESIELRVELITSL